MIKSGIIIPVLIMVPNLIYYLNLRNKSNVPVNNISASKFSQMSENIGRLGILFVPIFYTLNLNSKYSQYFILLCLLFLLLYYNAWLRHFVSGSQQIDMRKWLLVPLPLAVFPSLFLPGLLRDFQRRSPMCFEKCLSCRPGACLPPL